MPDINDIPIAREGELPSAAGHNAMRELLGRTESGPMVLVDSTGVHHRTPPAVEGGEWYYGKLDEDLDEGAGNYATVSVWRLNDDEDGWEDAGNNLEKCYAPPLMASGDTFTSGTWVEVTRGRDGRLWVTNAECAG